MTPEELKKRTMGYALRCVKLADSLPKGPTGSTIARQLVRSSTSTAANYRAACLARSKAEFISKLGIVEEEADETVFWIEFAIEAGLTRKKLVSELVAEGREITAIIVSSRKTAKARQRRQKGSK
jgi:four helix bundle protein